jgi:hypothetical protein
MADKTTNYNLTKPTPNEFYDIRVFNENADIIDQALKAHDDTLATHLAEHLRIEIGVAPPENPNSKTFWLENLGESIDFVFGGGLLIGNASTDGSDDVWFDENV